MPSCHPMSTTNVNMLGLFFVKCGIYTLIEDRVNNKISRAGGSIFLSTVGLGSLNYSSEDKFSQSPHRVHLMYYLSKR